MERFKCLILMLTVFIQIKNVMLRYISFLIDFKSYIKVLTICIWWLSCPFAVSYSYGRNALRLVEEKKAQLVSFDFRIDKGDPAYQIWEMFSYDEATRDLYNQSLAMILAQQFYIDQWQQKNKGHFYVDVQDLFSEVQPSVPIEQRCRRVQPICDPNEKYTFNHHCFFCIC